MPLVWSTPARLCTYNIQIHLQGSQTYCPLSYITLPASFLHQVLCSFLLPFVLTLTCRNVMMDRSEQSRLSIASNITPCPKHLRLLHKKDSNFIRRPISNKMLESGGEFYLEGCIVRPSALSKILDQQRHIMGAPFFAEARNKEAHENKIAVEEITSEVCLIDL